MREKNIKMFLNLTILLPKLFMNINKVKNCNGKKKPKLPVLKN